MYNWFFGLLIFLFIALVGVSVFWDYRSKVLLKDQQQAQVKLKKSNNTQEKLIREIHESLESIDENVEDIKKEYKKRNPNSDVWDTIP